MKNNKELEQIRAEYKEITVPEHAMAQMEEAMERAIYQRNRRRKLTTYSIVVAVLLCIVLLPTSLHMGSGGSSFNAKSESIKKKPTFMQSANTTVNRDGSEMTGSTGSAVSDSIVAEIELGEEMNTNTVNTVESAGMDNSASMSSKEQEDSLGLVIEIEKENSIWSVYFSKEQVKEINKEIYEQIEALEEQSVFLGISSEQVYYINEDGLLVVVWKEENLEFIIPKSIIFMEDFITP